MLLPIPIGYFVAVFLFFCGIMNCMEFLETQQEIASRAELLNELACRGWGIIAASVILLLIQMNRQLEKLRFAAISTHGTAIPIKSKKAKAEQEPRAAASPSNQVRPRQVYPNSPIPGGGRVPQTPDKASTPEPGKDSSGKLNYFKVD